MSTLSAPPSSTPPLVHRPYRRVVPIATAIAVLALAYVLRGVLIPLLFAFLLAYVLDPFVDWFEARKVPRSIAAPTVMLGIAGLLALMVIFAIPMFVDELRSVATDLPAQARGLEVRIEPWLWRNLHFRPPHTICRDGGRSLSVEGQDRNE